MNCKLVWTSSAEYRINQLGIRQTEFRSWVTNVVAAGAENVNVRKTSQSPVTGTGELHTLTMTETGLKGSKSVIHAAWKKTIPGKISGSTEILCISQEPTAQEMPVRGVDHDRKLFSQGLRRLHIQA